MSGVTDVLATWFGEQDCEVEFPDCFLCCCSLLGLTVFTVHLVVLLALCSPSSGGCWSTLHLLQKED